MSTIPRVSMGTEARKLVKETLGRAGQDDRSALKELFRSVAGADGNRHLSVDEAGIVHDTFIAGVNGEGVYDLPEISESILDRVEEIANDRDTDGVKAHFTSTNDNVGQVIIDEMRQIVAAADGRPVDINMMVFSFTDRDIADAILDIAENNPNVTFRLITDWSQIPMSGSRQPTRLHRAGLDNVIVKYKKDNPYVWSDSRGRIQYSHSATDGLNHHKGFVATIDGKPYKLATGSFNWSKSAARSNWENLFVFDDSNPLNRALAEAYQQEFTAFFNHPDTVNYDQAAVYRRQITNALRTANGRDPLRSLRPAEATPLYVPKNESESFDLNHMSDENYESLRRLTDSRVARQIVYHLATYGRFSSFDDLVDRCSKIRSMSEERREELREIFEFGDGRVPVNQASADELVRHLKITKRLAKAIVATRARVGDFESVAQLEDVPGMSSSILDRITPLINDDSLRPFFSGRGDEGYAPANADREVPIMGPDGEVSLQSAQLGAAIIDLMNRAQEGDEAKIAMYGMSGSVEAYDSIVEAARRGVEVKVLLNKAYNGGIAEELARLAREEDLPITVRFSRRTMHEKFGVVNDDVFFGSANMSGSATRKHSEDRFLVKNNADLARDLHGEFDRLWERARPA